MQGIKAWPLHPIWDCPAGPSQIQSSPWDQLNLNCDHITIFLLPSSASFTPPQGLILRALPLPNKLSVDKSVSDFASLRTSSETVGPMSDISQAKGYVRKPEGCHTKRSPAVGGQKS